MPDETKDTQPLLKDILEEMRSGFARMERQLAELPEIKKELRLLNNKVDHFGKELHDVIAEHMDFAERLSKIEKTSEIQ